MVVSNSLIFQYFFANLPIGDSILHGKKKSYYMGYAGGKEIKKRSYRKGISYSKIANQDENKNFRI